MRPITRYRPPTRAPGRKRACWNDAEGVTRAAAGSADATWLPGGRCTSVLVGDQDAASRGRPQPGQKRPSSGTSCAQEGHRRMTGDGSTLAGTMEVAGLAVYYGH